MLQSLAGFDFVSKNCVCLLQNQFLSFQNLLGEYSFYPLFFSFLVNIFNASFFHSPGVYPSHRSVETPGILSTTNALVLKQTSFRCLQKGNSASFV